MLDPFPTHTKFQRRTYRGLSENDLFFVVHLQQETKIVQL